MRIILLTGILILCSQSWSCTKTGQKISFNSTYYKTQAKPSSSYLVFTNHGEVSDPVIVSRFYAVDSVFLLYTSQNFIYNTYFMDSVLFTDLQHARMYHNSQWNKLDVTDQYSNYIFTRTDTSTSSITGDPYSQSLEYWICQYKPEIYQEWLISSTRGNYVFGYTTREKYLFKFAGDYLTAQMTLFIRHLPYLETEFVSNSMDGKFYQNLAPGDTIGVQTYSLFYDK